MRCRRSRGSMRPPISRIWLRSCPSRRTDRKSTRLNSSHDQISYAVFCLKKKKKQNKHLNITAHKTRHPKDSAPKMSNSKHITRHVHCMLRFCAKHGTHATIESY